MLQILHVFAYMVLKEHRKFQYNKLKINRNVRAGAKAREIKENSYEFTMAIKGNMFFSESDTRSFQDESCHESVFMRIRMNMRNF